MTSDMNTNQKNEPLPILLPISEVARRTGIAERTASIKLMQLGIPAAGIVTYGSRHSLVFSEEVLPLLLAKEPKAVL